MLDMQLIEDLLAENPPDRNSAIRVFDAGRAEADALAPAESDNARQEILAGAFGPSCQELQQAAGHQALNLRVQAALANQPTPQANQPAGNQPTGNQPAGNQPTGNQPAGNQPAGNQPTGNQPAGQDEPEDEPESNSRRGLPWWLWISLAVAMVAILIGGTAQVLRKAGWGPQTQQGPGIPALDPTPAAAPAAGNASLTNPVITLGNLSPLVLTRRTEFVASNDPQASQPNKVVCDALFTDSGSQITISGGLWADADGSIELSHDNGSSWTRVAEFSERIKLPEGSYRLRVGDDGGRSAISFQEAP